MKRTFFLLLISFLFFIACNNDKPKNEVTIRDENGKEKVIIDMDQVQDMQKRKEELAQLTPLSADELKAMVPAQLMGVEASGVDVESAIGANVVDAEYTINDSAEIKLEIVDCAGPGGAGVFGMQYLNLINVNSDDEEEYVRTIKLNGGKALENCRKKKNRCSLVWFSANRFLVSLRGDNIGIDALKEVAMSMKFQ